MNEETQRWLDTADRDRGMAQMLAEGGYFEGAAFHCQQAVEKVLKALFVAGGEWERTHSGVELLSGLRRLDVSPPEDVWTDTRKLDRAYISSRYPGSPGGRPEDLYDRKSTEELLACCDRVMEWAKSVLS